MQYTCESFGWYQEFLEQVTVDGFAAAEVKVLELLDRGGMIVHAYRETARDTPELVGRHQKLRSFNAGGLPCSEDSVPHEVERFLLDADHFHTWARAREQNAVVEQRWCVVELWPGAGEGSFYGKARLVRLPPVFPIT